MSKEKGGGNKRVGRWVGLGRFMSIKLAAGAVCGISSGGSSYAGTPVTVTLNNANTHAGLDTIPHI